MPFFDEVKRECAKWGLIGWTMSSIQLAGGPSITFSKAGLCLRLSNHMGWALEVGPENSSSPRQFVSWCWVLVGLNLIDDVRVVLEQGAAVGENYNEVAFEVSIPRVLAHEAALRRAFSPRSVESTIAQIEVVADVLLKYVGKYCGGEP